jgi:hypothetical protein
VLEPRYQEVAFYSFAFLNHSRLQSGMLQQLWLDHLLALAMKRTDRRASAPFVLMSPEINERSREAATGYSEALDPKQPRTFEARTLEEVITAFEDEANAGLAAALRERYLTPTG